MLALQELLCVLGESLRVVSALVASKVADELAEEWSILQREVLGAAKVSVQPRNATVRMQRCTPGTSMGERLGLLLLANFCFCESKTDLGFKLHGESMHDLLVNCA